MFQPTDPSAPPAELDFQLDPIRAPFFQIMQPEQGSERFIEVGFVWVVGSSRTNSLEMWFLYDKVTPDSGLAAYAWPGWDASGRFNGTTLKLVPSMPPSGVLPDGLKAHLERTKGVTLTYVKSACTPGR